MAEKSPSPDQKTQSCDTKCVAQASTSSDTTEESSTDSTKIAGDPKKSASNAGDGDGSGGEVSPESEMAFQRLFDHGDFGSLAEALEVEELEAPNGIPPTVVYERLLAVYLLKNDFHNAKLLWKRIPASAKTVDSELVAIWAVGQKVSKSDYAGIYQALRHPWKTQEKLMSKMFEVTRRRAIELVAKAYVSIAVDNLTALLGASTTEEAKVLAGELEWSVDGDMVYPKLGVKTRGTGANKFASSEAHLGLLTDYVSFLESH